MRAADGFVLLGLLAGGIVVGTGRVSPAQPAPDTERAAMVAPGAVMPVVPDAPAPSPAIGRHKGAWLLVSGSLAFATIGAVLAYSATSAENDVADLYVGFGDRPPVFDARTQKTYEALLSDGHRYEVMSWVSFGLAGVAAAGAAVLFIEGAREERANKAVRFLPTVHRDGGGLAATVRF